MHIVTWRAVKAAPFFSGTNEDTRASKLSFATGHFCQNLESRSSQRRFSREAARNTLDDQVKNRGPILIHLASDETDAEGTSRDPSQHFLDSL